MKPVVAPRSACSTSAMTQGGSLQAITICIFHVFPRSNAMQMVLDMLGFCEMGMLVYVAAHSVINRIR